MYDVCIIGSGAGGGAMAYALSRGGLRVLVLEKGPWYTPKDFVHDEISTIRRDFFVPSPDREPHMLDGERSSMGWIACCVGGGTVHMVGYFYRLHPDDFRMKTRFGSPAGILLADWPYSYAELEPYYTEVEKVIGVSGSAGTNPFEGPRSRPYPLPPVDDHPMAAWIDRAGKELGVHPFPSPRAVLSRDYAGRKACVYCKFCGSYGCEVGAKSSSLSSFLPLARKTGRCEIKAGCMVREIEVGKDGRATGCVWLDAEGREHRVKASIVCLSASAIESARLLLNSKSNRFPDGLANGSGLVGKNLQFSIFSGGRGVFPYDGNPVLKDSHPFLGRSLQDWYFLPEGVSDLPKGGTIRFGFPHANPIYTALRLSHRGATQSWGSELKREMKRYWREERTVEFETFADFLPNPGTRVDLDPEVRDRWGLPVARLRIRSPRHHEKAGRFLQEKGLEVLSAAGASEVHPETLAGVTGHLVHGTCRAGKDPEKSVLNGECRAHEVPNLYVVDGSFLPTSGGVPTTQTIMANGLRTAALILRK